MLKKISGYLIAVIGLISFLIRIFFPVRKSAEQFSNTLFLAMNLVMIIVGVIIVIKSSNTKVSEVPIYHGKEVVGYRRIKK